MTFAKDQAFAYAKEFYENLPTCVFLCDRDLQVLWRNKAACKIDQKTVTGFVTFFEPEQRKDALQELQRRRELKLVSLFGDREYALCFRLFGDDGVILEAELQRRSYLETFMDDEGSVMQLFTRVLRPSVGHMFNLLSVLKTDLEVREYYEDVEYMEMLGENCYFILRFMQNYSDYRRLIRGECKEQYVNIREELFQLFTTVQAHSFSLQSSFSFSLPEEEVLTCVPVEELNVALLHLISNAFKYTSPDNEISVKVNCTERSLMIQVVDQGVGIPQQNLKSIFAPFYSYNPNTSREEGAGIGLAYVRRFVSNMQGSCVVTSEENRGTRIALSIPLKKGNGEVVDSSLRSSLPPYYLSNFSPVVIYLADVLYKA